jgi:hypothetical protein
METLMKKTLSLCILSLFGNITAIASAQTLSCDVSFLTVNAKGLSTRYHSAAEHPGDPFFHFTIPQDVTDELYLHQNLCISGKDIQDRKLKGLVCLLVSSGSKLLMEPGTVPDEDLYLKDTSKVLTVKVSQMRRLPKGFLGGPEYLNSASEVALPVSGYRGNFSGGHTGGLLSLTVTCR